jgi:hypothetical protein
MCWKDFGRGFLKLIKNKLHILSENFLTNLLSIINLSLAYVSYCSTYG